MKFLLCLKCRAAGTSPGPNDIAFCCGEPALDCNPWSSDARFWYMARVKPKLDDIHEVLRTTSNWKWRSIARASRAKGREIARVA